MDKIKSHKDLKVWQKSMSLVTDIYSISANFPSNEMYGLTSQIRRAACSIALNIAEGYGRESLKNYIQFLRVSRGSLLELETCLQIAINLNYSNKITISGILEKIEEIHKMLNALIKSLTNKATVIVKEA